MKNIRKLILKIIILLIFLNVGGFSNVKNLIYAQESSESAILIDELISPIPTPTLVPQTEPIITSIENLNLDSVISTSSAPIISPTPLLLDDKVPLNSAVIEAPSKVHLLEKKEFQANEKIKLTLENFDTSQMRLSIKNNNGEEIPVYFEENKSDGLQFLTIESTNRIKPGRYTLTVVDHNGTESTQEFVWGVLAINTNKSFYLPGEKVNFFMAVLDNQGRMICNADAVLEITSPDGILTTLSTSDGTIKVNPECFVYDVNFKSDYEATFQTNAIGVYSYILNTKTNDGEHKITDSFEVKEAVPFDIERIGPTRIYVPEKYQMDFTIKFNQDFNGEIIETVPKSLTIYPKENLPHDSVNVLVTKEKISSIDTINLSYPFQGDFPYTQRFGVEETDPLMKKKYEEYGLIGHDGIDFKTPTGTSVLAVDSGEVVLAEDWDYGQTIVIQHDWGKSYYGHLSEFKVEVGQQVNQGDEIGLSGQTGLSTGPHLHFGIKLNKHNQQNGYYGKIGPLSYLGKPAEISDFSVKQITWKIDAKAGDTINLGYYFKTPNISPAFYLLGRLQLVEKNQNIIFKELRKWQIAADAVDTLYADSDISTTDWTSGTCSSNLWDCINEGTVSPNDGDYLKTSKGTGTFSYTHTATDSLSDVGTVTQIDFQIRGYYTVAASTVTVFYSTDGTTPSIQVGTPISLGVNAANVATYTVTASSLSLTKTQIDALRVRLQANTAKNAYVFITATEYDLTYDPAVTGPTNEQLMRHGKWFNSSGVRQPFVF